MLLTLRARQLVVAVGSVEALLPLHLVLALPLEVKLFLLQTMMTVGMEDPSPPVPRGSNRGRSKHVSRSFYPDIRLLRLGFARKMFSHP